MDITIRYSSELNVALVEGETEQAIDFIDAWFPEGEYIVLDSGRMTFQYDALPAFTQAAKERNFMMEQEETFQ